MPYSRFVGDSCDSNMLMLTQMYAFKSRIGFQNHLNGVGALLKRRGPEGLNSQTSRDVCYEFKSMEVISLNGLPSRFKMN